MVAALRDRFATLAWASPNSALSLVLQSKSRAKSFGLAELRQLLVVICHAAPLIIAPAVRGRLILMFIQ
ncbi:hypothetical protein EHO61_06080 [Leptospira fluminis]|uniref:Uncharacterized protein n=1 Tax=Leptospira fluminis TaxID=2484979 RepID=A0A4R9GT09_9LEPT|nr:hypothetical protein EHO61_06080 [Leptospira fluminis]